MIGFVSDFASEASRESQLNLVMDQSSYTMLHWLKGSLEATSTGEVIRRALQVYELVEPEDIGLAQTPESGCLSLNEDMKTIHVRISTRTKDRLDKERAASGGTYSQVIANSLRVLTQVVRNRMELIKDEPNETEATSHHQCKGSGTFDTTTTPIHGGASEPALRKIKDVERGRRALALVL